MIQDNSPIKMTHQPTVQNENLGHQIEDTAHLEFEKHIKVGQYIKSMVYGGLDGIITSLCISLSGIGSAITAHSILALGFSALLGDALSMAVADYLATKSDSQYMETQRRRQLDEIEGDMEVEKRQMLDIYGKLGLEPIVANEIVNILIQNREGFLKVMMIEELQLIADEQNPIKNSIVTFFSFCIFGLMPLIPIIIAKVQNVMPNKNYLAGVIVLSGFFLSVLAFIKSFVSGMKWYWSILETLIVGAISASAAFGIGKALGD